MHLRTRFGDETAFVHNGGTQAYGTYLTRQLYVATTQWTQGSDSMHSLLLIIGKLQRDL